MADDPNKKTSLAEHMQTFVLILVVTVGGLLLLRYFGIR
ncbi:MAG: hypothetical protein RLZ98_3104 [Pseudomonadota bacterium]|jgi:hypothetical protein